MKTKIHIMIMLIVMCTVSVKAQLIRVSPELKELIGLSVAKDHKIAEKNFDKQISEEQQKAVRSAFIPKVELGGKYVFAYSTINSNIGEIGGFESLPKLQEFMQTPAFPAIFPHLAAISSELANLQKLMVQQNIQLPSVTKNLDGSVAGNYFGVDATAKMLLYSGGQVPNVSKALSEKVIVQEALTDKYQSEVIIEVITCYDQLALLNQSKHVLDESADRLAAEKKYAVSAVNNGLATAFDTLKIAVAEAGLNARISDYESKRVLLHQKLSQLTGKPVQVFETINPVLEILFYADLGSDITKRAELRALNAALEAQKFMLKAEKSHYLPKIQALASARYDNIFKANANFNAPVPIDMNSNNIGLGPTLLVGVGFKWDIFDRSGGYSKERVAALELKKAETERDEVRELLLLNVTKTTTNYQSAGMQVTFRGKQRQAACMALELAEKSYQEGVINITERLAAETEVQSAELGFLEAVFNQRQSALECYHATGNLVLSNFR
jgi:outer membrane protein TolC